MKMRIDPAMINIYAKKPPVMDKKKSANPIPTPPPPTIGGA
jgi:hypothetical protein